MTLKICFLGKETKKKLKFFSFFCFMKNYFFAIPHLTIIIGTERVLLLAVILVPANLVSLAALVFKLPGHVQLDQTYCSYLFSSSQLS
jgi:hypothetical protein